MIAKKFKLFDNLSQMEYNGSFFDFHNDYNCTSLSLENNEFSLLLSHIRNENQIILKFSNTKFVNFHFDLKIKNESLTIDNLYRGRFELNGILHEFSESDSSYFYLEFYEGQSFEFFCDELLIE